MMPVAVRTPRVVDTEGLYEALQDDLSPREVQHQLTFTNAAILGLTWEPGHGTWPDHIDNDRVNLNTPGRHLSWPPSANR